MYMQAVAMMVVMEIPMLPNNMVTKEGIMVAHTRAVDIIKRPQ